MIGIGVTTFNRPNHLRLWTEQMNKYLPEGAKVYIAYDYPQKGIAYRKNECLRELKDCDHIFLFDDDCLPIKSGWEVPFITQSVEQKHFQYNSPHQKVIGTINGINIYQECSGCLMYMTKEVIEKVGGYNPNYGLYGFEHAGYTKRIHDAGLTPLGKYSTPTNAHEFIYSLDLQNTLPFNRQVKHRPSMAPWNIPQEVMKNRKVYDEDNVINIPL